MSEKRKIQRFNLDEGRIWEAIEGLSPFKTTYTLEEVCEKLNEQQATIVHLRKQIQIYEQLIANSYVGVEETLDGFVGKYVIWENELQKYKNKNEMIGDE